MKILTKEEMWDLSIECARILSEKKVPMKQMKNISQKEVVELTGIETVGEIPATYKKFDGHDYDEEDTFDFLRTLVRFQMVAVFKCYLDEKDAEPKK